VLFISVEFNLSYIFETIKSVFHFLNWLHFQEN
jgi:hypothetical protein